MKRSITRAEEDFLKEQAEIRGIKPRELIGECLGCCCPLYQGDDEMYCHVCEWEAQEQDEEEGESEW